VPVPYALLQSVFVPLLAVLVVVTVGPKVGKKIGWVAVASLIYTTLLLLSVGVDMARSGNSVVEEYAWASFPSLTVEAGFLADGLSFPVALVMSITVLACAIYSIHYMEHRIEVLYGKGRNGMFTTYYAAFLLFATGLIGVSLSTNLIELFVFLEMVLIPPFLHIGLFGYGDRERIAMIYFVWNHVGAGVFLIGILLIVLNSGSFKVGAISSLAGSPIAFWVVLFVIVGWLVKMAVFGFHVWLPHAHGNTPTAIAPIIAAIVGLGNYIIVRMLVSQLFDVFRLFGLPLMIIALVTMLYGGFLTFAQDDYKYLYACSTISQTAYSLLGIGSLSLLGVTGGIFYFLSHTLGKGILFQVAGIVVTQTGTRDIRQMGGLAYKMPVTATLAIMGSMILSAMPPLSGFQAELVMFIGIFLEGTFSSLLKFIIAIVGIATTIFTVAYTFWPVRRVFFGPLPSSTSEIREAHWTMIGPPLMLALVSLLIGVFPGLVMNYLTPFAESQPIGGP